SLVSKEYSPGSRYSNSPTAIVQIVPLAAASNILSSPRNALHIDIFPRSSPLNVLARWLLWKSYSPDSLFVFRTRPDESETENSVLCSRGSSVMSRKYRLTASASCWEVSFADVGCVG